MLFYNEILKCCPFDGGRSGCVKSKSIIHFGSDEWAEMASAYHSIISIVKLNGCSAWEYLEIL